MEWSIGNSGSRYNVSFSEKEELLSLTKLISEDQKPRVMAKPSRENKKHSFSHALSNNK